MTIPDYQKIMLPLLELASDQQEHAVREAYEHISQVFQLTSDERGDLLPSGRQPIIENRVGWSRTYMAKAGLLESPRRGYFRITSRGLELLQQRPSKIDLEILRRFPEFVEFQGRKDTGNGQQEIALAEGGESSRTPQELLEYGYESIRGELRQELLDLTKQCSPRFFERLVIELLLRMGYGGSRADAGEAIGRSGDGGIDGIIKEDKLGLDVIYVQAKRWEGSVGSSEVRNFVGSLVGQNANKGVFITTSRFTPDAEEFARTVAPKVILIGGQTLADLMMDHGVGVTTEETYEVKRVDTDYFIEE